jgi:hypothetical protein
MMMENVFNLCQLNIENIMFHVGGCLICIKMIRIGSSWVQMHGKLDHFKSHNGDFFTMVLHCTLLRFIAFFIGFSTHSDKCQKDHLVNLDKLIWTCQCD